MLAFCNAITSAALGSDLGPTGQANGSGGGQEAKTGEEMGLTDPKTPRRETVPKRRLEGLERNGRDGAASPETYHGYHSTLSSSSPHNKTTKESWRE